MVAFVHMTPLQQAQALYVDAYKDAWGRVPPMLPPSKWESIEWLEDAIDSLVEDIAWGNENESRSIP